MSTHNYEGELVSTPSDVQTIVNTAIATAHPAELEPGKIYGWALPDGRVEQIDLTGDEHRDQPRRKSGTVVVDDLDSFAHYYGKHADEGSEVYVHIDRHYLTAILDAHTGDAARWGEHRLLFRMATTERWNAWTGMDRKPMKQVTWAEWIEDHLDDIREPAAATMLEIAQTFQANTKVKFGSTHILANGDRKLTWEETTDATAGSSGKLQVPATFTIGVAPFEFADPYAVEARFRYRVASGELSVCYLLNDPAAIIRSAVLDVIEQVEEKLKVKVMQGTPA